MFKDISIKIGLVIQRERESELKSIYWGYTMGWNNFWKNNHTRYSWTIRTAMIAKCSYGVPNSNPGTRKSLTFTCKNSN